MDDGDSDSLLNEVIREIDPDFFKAKENPKAKPIKGLISFARNVGKDVEEVARARYPANRELITKIDQFLVLLGIDFKVDFDRLWVPESSQVDAKMVSKIDVDFGCRKTN